MDEAIGAAAIRVRRVVVVGITAGVHIPRVVGIATISGAQTAVLGLQPTPHFYLNFAEYRFKSDSLHARIRFLVSIVLPAQYVTRFVLR